MDHVGRLNGAYLRLEQHRAVITPAETVIIMRDMHNRLQKLEESDAKQQESTPSRRRSAKDTEEKVSSD